MSKLGAFFYKLAGAECCEIESGPGTAAHQILLVGSPNVGKSALFNQITGKYVTVSNYPGTTVEIFRGTSQFFDADTEIIDTPGMYSLMPISDEERVGRDILLDGTAAAVLVLVISESDHIGIVLGDQVLERQECWRLIIRPPGHRVRPFHPDQVPCIPPSGDVQGKLVTTDQR